MSDVSQQTVWAVFDLHKQAFILVALSREQAEQYCCLLQGKMPCTLAFGINNDWNIGVFAEDHETALYEIVQCRLTHVVTRNAELFHAS